MSAGEATCGAGDIATLGATLACHALVGAAGSYTFHAIDGDFAPNWGDAEAGAASGAFGFVGSYVGEWLNAPTGAAGGEPAPPAAPISGGIPSFIVNANGEIIPIPEGASGPTPVGTGKGFQFTGGRGGNGLDSRVTGVRLMDPVTTGKYPDPSGYISYMNADGQTVNPWTGQTVSNSDPWAHWPWSP